MVGHGDALKGLKYFVCYDDELRYPILCAWLWMEWLTSDYLRKRLLVPSHIIVNIIAS